ncbi:MAG: indole-3-glycerol phosphate synthase TrpC [Alphaproteobacteria bacterium]
MSSVLERISAYKRKEIAERKAARPREDVEAAARAAPTVRDFQEALRRRIEGGGYGLIAECKKASPSRGLIRTDFDVPALARAYEAGGAACLSVLTDGPSFQGADEFLKQARAAASLPVLRKDFLFDPYQVAESRALGADCILIILAAVSDEEAVELERTAFNWGMDALLEVHNEAELERALELRSPLIGINNRDLNTFETDAGVTERVAPLVPPHRLAVSESGLRTPDDLARMARAGVRAFLIGESLMRADDVAAATRRLLANPPPAEKELRK